MARPRRRPRLVGEPTSQLSGQVALRQAQEAAAAQQQATMVPQATSTTAAGVQAPAGSSVGLLDAPGVLEGVGPPPPEPVEQPAAAPGVEPSSLAGADGLEPEFMRRLNALVAASGGRVRINSGYRSYEQQARLYAQAVAEHGANAGDYAAPPGKSNHNRGLAADLEGDLDIAHRLAPQFGLVFPMDHEEWHIEPVGLRQDGSTPPEAYTAPGVKEAPMKRTRIRDAQGNEAEVGVEAMATVMNMVLSDAVAPVDFNYARHLGEQKNVTTPEGTPEVLEGTGPPPPEPVEESDAAAVAPQGGESGEGGDAESWIREAMRITGVDESWYPGLKARMMQESGGRNIPQGIVDVNTAKGTPAFGPMQVIQPTFNSHKLAGYENWKDPLHNTIAAIRYISARYGHPSKLPRGGY